jgi:hypothetical protein
MGLFPIVLIAFGRRYLYTVDGKGLSVCTQCSKHLIPNRECEYGLFFCKLIC